jgi:hypothetical protein
MIEPSDMERAEWPDTTRQYVEDLEALLTRRFGRGEVHISEALEISDNLGHLIQAEQIDVVHRVQEEVEQVHGVGSIILALRALAGAYRRLKC